MKRNKAWRRDNDKKLIVKRKKLLRDLNNKDYLKKFEGEEHRLAVKHPLDCGRTDCGICHHYKVNKACASKSKDEHILVEQQIEKEVHDELRDDMCDFGD
jgi:hypothetical protein